jgi:hypothetical protein
MNFEKWPALPAQPGRADFFVSIYVFNAYFGTENRVLEVRSTKNAKTAVTSPIHKH